jgi:transcriptional regulator with XRE-family HTH domain
MRQHWAKLQYMSNLTINELKADLAANLKRLRAERGYAQDSLALDSGVHRTMLSKIERCISNPSLDTLVKLANTLDVTVSELLKQRS